MTNPEVSGGATAGDAQADRYAGIVSTEPKTETEAPQAEEKVEEQAQTEPVEAEAEKDETEEEPQTERKPKKGGYTRKLERMEALIADLNAKLSEKEQPKAAEKAAEANGRPVLDDYDNYDAYYEALTDWKVEQRLKSEKETAAQAELRKAQEKQVAEYRAKAAEFAKSTPDFEEVIEEADVAVTPALQQVLLESDMGPQIAYYLAKNPEEASKASKMGLIELSRLVGRIEAKIELEASSKQQVVKKATNAPAPIRPVGNGKAATAKSITDPNLSYEDYVRLRAQQ